MSNTCSISVRVKKTRLFLIAVDPVHILFNVLPNTPTTSALDTYDSRFVPFVGKNRCFIRILSQGKAFCGQIKNGSGVILLD